MAYLHISVKYVILDSDCRLVSDHLTAPIQFGQIVRCVGLVGYSMLELKLFLCSARVMRNENGESRGFGFVSYQTPDQGEYNIFRPVESRDINSLSLTANAALHAMNGVVLGSKQLVVRLHEPKQLRQEKLAQRFGHNGHPRNASGATSPTVSEAGDSFGGWSSPRHATSALGSPIGMSGDRPERGRRGSGSYYNVRSMSVFSHSWFNRLTRGMYN
jgi:RNA recognition motif-containing protein